VSTVVNGKTVYNTLIVTYLCPSDSSSPGGQGATTNGSAHLWTVGNYSANYMVFGNPGGSSTAAREQGAGKLNTTFRDGTSNTLMFTERYGTCGSSGVPNAGNTYGNLWSDSNSVWRPVFCINNASQSPGGGYTQCNRFQVQPNWIKGCDSTRPQSPHVGGINGCLGDGSIRFISGTISDQTWWDLCNPQEGNVLGSDF
jgi:hypothetical protein